MDTNVNTNWSDIGISEQMLEQIKAFGYKHPSPVQEKTIPLALQGKDVLVSSQTGSGKTASFVIPSVDRFKEKNGTYILALSPTREIAQQTGEVFASFAKPFGMKVAVCIGGANMNDEKEALATSPHTLLWQLLVAYVITLNAEIFGLISFSASSLMKLIVCLRWDFQNKLILSQNKSLKIVRHLCCRPHLLQRLKNWRVKR